MLCEPTAHAALARAHILWTLETKGWSPDRISQEIFRDGVSQSFREPLYLTDHALQLPDTRSNEQRRFPELFPHLTLTSSSVSVSFL